MSAGSGWQPSERKPFDARYAKHVKPNGPFCTDRCHTHEGAQGFSNICCGVCFLRFIESPSHPLGPVRLSYHMVQFEGSGHRHKVWLQFTGSRFEPFLHFQERLFNHVEADHSENRAES